MRFIRFYFQAFFRQLRYYFKARTKYDVHSPFVADFIENTLEDERWFYTFSTAEALRSKLLQDRTTVAIDDLGAGSMVFTSNTRSLRDLVRHTAASPALGRLLFRIVNWHKPATMLELGTSLGISAIYQASAALDARMITIEGCAPLAQLAQRHLKEAGLENVEVMTGAFQQALPKALKALGKLDFVYLDGDHRAESTLAYFEQCLPYAHEGSLFAIGDIHWSHDMESVWNALRKHPQVSLSIDLYDLGLLFFRKAQKEKEDFTLIRAKRKPWRLGFFS